MTDSSTEPGALLTPPAQSFTGYLVMGVVILNLVVAAIGWFSLKRSKSHYEERAVITTQNLSKILDENLTGTFAKVEIAMLAIVDEAERQLAVGGIRADSLNRSILREHGRLPELITFRATDASGEAIYGLSARPVNTTSLGHRDYFKRLKEVPDAGLVISKPLIGGITGRWMIVLARRINRPDGAFAGLVYTGVSLDYLAKNFSRIDIGKHGSITLIDGDATIAARYPDDPAVGSLMGLQIPSKPLAEAIRTRQTEGVYVKASSLDAVERTFSFRRLGVPQPFYILVGFATADHLMAWRHEAWELIAIMAVFFLITIVSAVLIQWEWRRNEKEVSERKQAQALLFRRKEELEATLARTKRLEGIISICMHCKKIHNKQASWEQIEHYISDNSDALFSHGICPECLNAHYPGLHGGKE